MKAKEETRELQTKDFIISINKSLKVKDNTQYGLNGY